MFSLLTKSTTFILGDISNIFGVIINAIYNFFNSAFGIQSIGVTIIVFTILVRVLMLPLAIKQQKSTQEMQKIQPELKKLQEKYKDKKDQEQQRKYQEEMSSLYKEHGVNPFGGCLPLLIQMPIIFALFAVLRNIPAYIDSIKDVYLGINAAAANVTGYKEAMNSLNAMNLTAEKATPIVKDLELSNIDKVIDLMVGFTPEHWAKFKDLFSSVNSLIQPLTEQLNNIYNFFTIDLSAKPEILSVGVLIPILCLIAQLLITKTMSTNKTSAAQDQTQKTMTYMMPIITVFFVLQMPAGLGIYWLTGNVFQLGQQVVINKLLVKEKK